MRKLILLGLVLFVSSCAVKPPTDDCSRGPQSVGIACVGAFSGDARAEGPRLVYAPKPGGVMRSLDSISNLRILSQNFKLLIGQRTETWRDGSTHIEEKSEVEKIALARRIQKSNPDIIIGTEVKDAEAREYVKQYLADKYVALSVKGNDVTEKDIVYFIKKDLPLQAELLSYKYAANPENGRPVFSRDLPVMLMRSADAKPDSPPLFAVLGTHYKSQRKSNPPDPKDPDGVALRASQVIVTTEIIAEIQKKYPGLAVFLGGDFNGDMRSAAEFKPLLKSGLKDSFDLSSEKTPVENRGTFYHFYRANPSDRNSPIVMNVSQLDAVLVNKAAEPFIINTRKRVDIDDKGNPVPPPKIGDKKDERGSDHEGIEVDINFRDLVKSALNIPN